ncbi:MAG: xanthine dehydrogenase family protein molybdopterin-binding subunit [Actinomycetota bacterium]|nr:xanthine dehydrogenase family protein molybdopterin-binding subunit [Actinomycetota bacterium]
MTTSIFGSSVLRSEDPRFLRGAGRYVDNLPIEGALRVVFLRSILAHAKLGELDTSPALGMPGVAAVFIARDLELPPMAPGGVLSEAFARPLLARERVRFVGEPVAAVVAETSAQAEDAAEVLLPDYEPLPAVTDPAKALVEGAAVLFPEHGSNLANEFEEGFEEDPLEGADVVVRGRFLNQRVAPAPLEVNAAAVIPENGGLMIWASSQVPFDVRSEVAEALGLDEDKVRVIAPDVGGGFGAKIAPYPEQIVLAAIAMRLGRPVRWIESRSESMLALTHGRGQIQEVELGARRDGTIVGLRAEVLADMGAYPGHGIFLPPLTHQMASGVYRIPRIAFRGRSVVTNSTPIAPYRGAGRPEAAAMIERAVDLLAAELEMDPAEVRRVNMIGRDAFPHTTATGAVYDSGDYEGALDAALDRSGYAELRDEQSARRRRGDRLQLGIGISTYVEVTGFTSHEFGSVEAHRDGTFTVRSGISPHGQGHETSLAQIASGSLGAPFECVRVVHSDTGEVAKGEGTYGSRSLQLGGSAVLEASHALVEKARRLAAHLLGLEIADVVALDGGRFGTADGSRAVDWGELAEAADDPARLPGGMEPGLRATSEFRQRESTYPFGAHVSVAEVDVETGDARVVRHVAVDDCGRILNPMLVRGQVHGGLAQGIGQALYESFTYDELGTPLNGNFATYGIPSAAELPSFETSHTETPTPNNPLGVKGIGEAATIGSTPAVQNAVIDAVAHLGVRHIDMPLSPERVWSAIRDARSETA